MNLSELQDKLVAAARATRPSDTVPYAFEKRIMARLAVRPRMDIWALWNRVLWRAAAPSIGVVLLLGVWTFFSEKYASGETLAADLENVVLAPFDYSGETW